MICTIYSHYPSFEKIKETLHNFYPKGNLAITSQDGFSIVTVELRGGLFSSAKKLKISYRERKKPSYQIPAVDDSALTANLRGLFGYVQSLTSSNETIKNLFLQKIQTLNCEFSVIEEQGMTPELKPFIEEISRLLDAVLFVQPKTIISKSSFQHFLDKNLNLILDLKGNCEIDRLDVKIDPAYFKNQAALKPDQTTRKAASEKILEQRKVKINHNLPCIESDSDIKLRPPKEIAERLTVLAMTNLVAFNSLSGGDASHYLKKYNLWHLVTPNEQLFLSNPTEEQKNHETWKCECIWTLMWALNKVHDLGFPNSLCDLKSISPEDYPVGPNKDPNDFIAAATQSRPVKEIADANDLYYRLDWACVDARMHNNQIAEVNPGVVYERHYALNWLIRYLDQDWDYVSCDT